MHYTALILSAALLGLAAGQSDAKPCRDASGHYIACPTASAAPAATGQRCRDAKGAFIKCPAPTAAAATPASKAQATAAAKPAPTTRPSRTAAAAPTGTAANTSAVAPAGAVTARCRDGSTSHSQHRSGTCARHGGVASWM